MDAGTRDFATPEEAEASPLAEALFALGDVTGVFFGRDFVSVTAAPGVDWPSLKPDVLAILHDHFAARMPLFRSAAAPASPCPPTTSRSPTDDPADADIIAQIRELIDTRVRPAVANDGGDIVYRGFDKGKVYLRMQGACSGCPSSTRDAQERHRATAAPLCPRSHRSARGLMRARSTPRSTSCSASARSYNGYTDEPVAEDELHAIWDLMKMGPDLGQPAARAAGLVRVATRRRTKLAACCSAQNAPKIRKAPVAVVIGMDTDFHEHLPELFPHTDAKSWFDGNRELREASAFRNSSLQGAYFIIAARALGLDTGPMSGFDGGQVDAAFFADTPAVRTNFISTLGHGDPATIFDRLPAARTSTVQPDRLTQLRCARSSSTPPTAACSVALIEDGAVVARRARGRRARPCRAAGADDRRAARRRPRRRDRWSIAARAASPASASASPPRAGWGSAGACRSTAIPRPPLIAAAALVADARPTRLRWCWRRGHGEVFMQVFDARLATAPAARVADARGGARGARRAAGGRQRRRAGCSRSIRRWTRPTRCPTPPTARLLPAALATLPPRPIYGRAPDAKPPARRCA